MSKADPAESQAQRFETWPRWKRWLCHAGILDRRILLTSDAERQKSRREILRRLAFRPLWEKWLTIAGIAAAAISVGLYPWLFGHLTIGWEELGIARTIVPSEEPVLFLAVLLLFESLLVCLLCLLTKIYFFSDRD